MVSLTGVSFAAYSLMVAALDEHGSSGGRRLGWEGV